MRRLHHHRWPAVVTAATILLITAACGSHEQSRTAHSEQSRKANAEQSRVSRDSRPLTSREQDTLHNAEQLLTRSCMARRGFELRVVPRRPLADDRDFPYVIDDVRWASRHGYGSDLLADRERLRAGDPNRKYYESLTAADRKRAVEALNGRPSARRVEVKTPDGLVMGRIADGCTAWAQEQLYGDLATWFRATSVTTAVDSGLRSEVAGDARFDALVRRWSGCMKGRGFTYADPMAARQSFLGATKTPDRAAEVRTAVAESHCADDTGMTAAVGHLERLYRERAHRKQHEQFSIRARLEREALPRARALTHSTDSRPTLTRGVPE